MTSFNLDDAVDQKYKCYRNLSVFIKQSSNFSLFKLKMENRSKPRRLQDVQSTQEDEPLPTAQHLRADRNHGGGYWKHHPHGRVGGRFPFYDRRHCQQNRLRRHRVPERNLQQLHR